VTFSAANVSARQVAEHAKRWRFGKCFSFAAPALLLNQIEAYYINALLPERNVKIPASSFDLEAYANL